MRPAPDEIIAVFLGGVVGAIARAELDTLIDTAPGHWPWSTFAVNITGAFLLGYFATRLQLPLPFRQHHTAFLEVGFCGALTTFSALQLELLQMLDADRIALAVAYAGTSIVLGYAAVAAAAKLARRVEART